MAESDRIRDVNDFLKVRPQNHRESLTKFNRIEKKYSFGHTLLLLFLWFCWLLFLLISVSNVFPFYWAVLVAFSAASVLVPFSLGSRRWQVIVAALASLLIGTTALTTDWDLALRVAMAEDGLREAVRAAQDPGFFQDPAGSFYVKEVTYEEKTGMTYLKTRDSWFREGFLVYVPRDVELHETSPRGLIHVHGNWYRYIHVTFGEGVWG